MNTNKPKAPTSATLPMSAATKQRLTAVAKRLEGQELFPEKVARAKQAFKGLKTLPL
jgi:hypothetical protein